MQASLLLNGKSHPIPWLFAKLKVFYSLGCSSLSPPFLIKVAFPGAEAIVGPWEDQVSSCSTLFGL